ncbi:EAL domain-containing protein [Halioxenophilus sp. WMMB6]|uniref:EAL domain-containing protein n=1 Tax=Halioxenophilus sp. WMMB6 TaxID=3073815 RepID=UPI00295EEB39|nr:EAL domain-containing protein [Halioxenophilus sp. WMMB6]
MIENTVSILIVEDESIVAMDLSRQLARLGYKIEGTAARGDRALALALATSPDIILMDIRIKGEMDGVDTAAKIQSVYPVPIIFLTAHAEDSTLSRAKAVKPYGYLLKPFAERDLHVAIQVALERFKHDELIKHQENHLRLALDSTQAGTWEMASAAAPIIFGYIPEAKLAVMSDWQTLYRSIVPLDRKRIKSEMAKLTEENSELTLEFRCVDEDGCNRWFKLNGKSYFDHDHADYRAIGVIQEITKEKQVESKLKQAALVFDHSAEGIVVLNAEKKVISVNSAFHQMTGYSESDLLGRELPVLSRHNIDQKTYTTIWADAEAEHTWQGQLRMFCENGALRHVWANIAAVKDASDQFGKFVVVLSDITEVHDAHEKLAHIAYHDTLTGLPNRSLLRDRLNHAISKAKRDQSSLAVLFLDLDHFKRINDTMGHQVGDSLLVTITKRLLSEIRATDTLGRIGGDEFILLLEGVQSDTHLEFLCEKLLATLAQPVMLAGIEVTIGGSIGIGVYPRDAQTAEELIKSADMAMYAAKTAGRNKFTFFKAEMSDYTTKYFSREQELRRALKQNEFRLHYQPQIDAACGECVGCEALLRWQHPEKGLLGANEIIPYAEASSLILDVGNWVIDEATRQMREWRTGNVPVPIVGINISVPQLEDRSFTYKLMTRLAQLQLNASDFEIEVTESCLQDNEQVVLTLNELANKGLAIAIDDFGTGYSCMSSLKYLPLDRIKIDQKFIRDVPEDMNDCSIVKAIVALGKQLNLKVVAEGIENRQQMDFLLDIGCDHLQGYYLGRPVAVQEFEQLLAQLNQSKWALP